MVYCSRIILETKWLKSEFSMKRGIWVKVFKKGIRWLKKNKFYEISSYLFFGVLTTIVNIIIHFIGLNLFSWHYLLATVVSWFAAVSFAFVTNKKWVFGSITTTKKEWFIEFMTFIFYRLVSLVMDMGSMLLLIEVFQFDNLWAKIVTQILVVVANYLFSKLFIFSKK